MALIGILSLSFGCRKKRISVLIPGGSPRSVAYQEINGIASWYGDPFHGRRTSNGEVYNMYTLTAAHRTLPFNTVVQVNNLDNGMKVQVRINDRGPFIDGRIIDLSYAAAQQIDMILPGIAKVRLNILRMEATNSALSVQVGSFLEKERAEKLAKEIRKGYSPVKIRVYESAKGRFHRVLVGEYSLRTNAVKVLRRLSSDGYNGFVIMLEK